ncbi:hypothetical protein GCM10017783_23370 [Deinococcus piscis]|uniref:RiboL-PSP-HEPN domain-containing protein n=2 Tax=Deinococcus piscis TaxID=394230 RepID=A0ABQ3K9X2_9DEIO|nr:hypothetical protein GCM10017783_23370 [Deinococcus piscis]
MWNRRVEIVALAESTEIIEISSDDIPLDGKTIRPEHFETIWGVFGFSGSYMPSPRHALALNNLADSRNTVAHGDEVPERFGRTKTATDISRLLDLSEEIIIHLIATIEKYIDEEDYKR